MTGTLSGYLVHRLQDKIKDRTGITISYNDMIYALAESLIELENDMQPGDIIDLPTGRYLTISNYFKYKG